MCRIRGNHDTRSRQIEWTRGGKGDTTMSWYIGALKKYADFNGRAGRAEFWMFTLISAMIGIVLYLIDERITPGSDLHVLLTLYTFAVLLPSLAVTVRRLHDTGRSGWWLLITLVPILGQLAYLVFLAQDSQPAANQYGSSPKMATA
jgi:uncharacterized membrane protein YhaH (DUF805 family)